MSQRIIGRRKETEILMNCMDSSKPEFVAVIGIFPGTAFGVFGREKTKAKDIVLRN